MNRQDYSPEFEAWWESLVQKVDWLWLRSERAKRVAWWAWEAGRANK